MILKEAVLSACIGFAALQHPWTIISGGTHIGVTNQGGKLEGLRAGDKEKHVDLLGDPAQLQAFEKGFTAKGKELEFTWAELDAKTTEFRKGRIEGNGSLIYDSEMAQKALIEQAKTTKKLPPVAPAESSFIQADSERFSYLGNVNQGTITMPAPFTLLDSGKGTETKTRNKISYRIRYDQTLTASGAKGELHIIKGPDGNLGKLSTGSFEGPVHFKIVRHEIPDVAAHVDGFDDTNLAETSTYSGVADHLDVDLTTTPGTITAHGNVTVDADTPTLKATFHDDEFQIFVSEKMEPISLKFRGSPGKTTAKPKDGK